MSKYIYVEPTIMAYNVGERERNNYTQVKDFLSQLKRVLNVFEEIKCKMIIDFKISAELNSDHPLLPFDDIKNIDPKKKQLIKAMSSTLREGLFYLLKDGAYLVSLNQRCNFSSNLEGLVSKAYQIDFMNLLLSNCSNKVTAETILKDGNETMFDKRVFKLSCNHGNCDRTKFETSFDCLDIETFYNEQQKELINTQLLQFLQGKEESKFFEVKQDKHAPLFRKKVKSLDDVPSPEKDLLIELNKIIDIKEVHFREYEKRTSKKSVTLYNLNEESNHDEYLITLKGILSLKNSSVRACNITIIASRDCFGMLKKFIDSNNLEINVENLENINKKKLV